MPTWLASTVAKSTATLDGDEVIRIIDDPSGTPVSAKTTVTALKNYISTAIDSTYVTAAEAAAAYQPLDADLTTLGGLAKADGNFIVGDGSGWTVESGATARTSLGLGTMATEAASTYQTKAFTQSGTGAVARTVEAKLQEVLSVDDFGATGDGATDDLAAFTNAFTRALAADVPLIIPGGDYNLSGSLTPALGNLRFSCSPDAEFNGAGRLDLDDLIPFQIAPIFAREFVGGAYDGSFTAYSNVFQNASYAKATASGFALVAQFGEGEAAAASSEAWGGNFVGVSSISGGTAIAAEINPVVTAAGGAAYGVVIASAGSQPSTAAIQMQTNAAAAAFTDGIKFNSATHQVATGALIKASGSTAAYGIDFRGSTFGTAILASDGATIDYAGNYSGNAAMFVSVATVASVGASSAAVTAKNVVDNSNVTALIIEGDRATPAANDNVHAKFKLSNGAGTQTEVARISAYETDITAGAEVSELRFAVLTAGALANRVTLSATALFPQTNDAVALGSTTKMWADLYLASGGRIYHNNGAFDTWGTGTPEGAVTAPVGSTFRRTDGGAGTTFYVKESGTGNTGWVGK